MELNIYHLYPDVLNLYGDRGNVLCMQRRLEWRGMQANLVNVPIGTKLDAKNCDLIFIGGSNYVVGTALQSPLLSSTKTT